MRSMEPEKADGDTVRNPGQSALDEHAAGNVFTRVGGIIMEPGETLPKERQRNVKVPSGYLTALPKSRYLTIHELLDFFPLFICMYYIM